jgi:hypothetical protein
MPTGIAGTIAAGGNSQRTAYGQVPSSISIPPNVFTQLSGAVPNFGANTSGTGNVIQSQLAGTVSPMTLNALKTGAAQFGVASGMPGSGLETNQLFGNIAGFSEGQQEKGVQNYLNEVGTLSRTMTDPNLAATISARNTDLAAAPDPRLAHDQQIRDYLNSLANSYALSNPQRGPWWAPGGVNTPPIGATIGRSYAGGIPGPGGVDALGFPTYQTPEAGTTATLGAINPTATTASAPQSFTSYYPGADTGEGYTDPSYGEYAGYSGG